ncbi:hypothetical protein P280DRAFT_169289 [Massarina eburnea CBS 473.64]|uniref:Uncharacterized protein n=1 Tax=Massarina eburnea CBS 473.64 TaxID=1395130 RepID=A0A6A6RJI0_9PLEO|nr:hypothetical protein P280DRAFT_169289 [Massarina eburnea CBS 473.64]
MSRELPRKVRRELKIAIEKLVGPIEETLKTRLEVLVRNFPERLSREYVQDKVSSDSSRQSHTSINSSPGVEEDSEASLPPCTQPTMPETLHAFTSVVADIDASCWPWKPSDPDYIDMPDQTYFSNLPTELPSDDWWSLSNTSTTMLNTTTFNPETPLLNAAVPPYTRKGKGRVDASFIDFQAAI